MEEKEGEAWVVVEDAAFPCLSPVSDFLLSSVHEHRRTTSYGTFSREFRLDTDTLNYLLSNLDAQKARSTCDCGLNCDLNDNCVSGSSSHNVSQADDLLPVVAGEENDEILRRQQKLGHRQKDSGIHSPCYIGCSSPIEWSPLYLAECNRQLENLWSFTGARLDQIANEYEDCQSKHNIAGADHFGIQVVNTTQASIQADVDEKKSLLGPEDSDIESIGEDSGIEEDHLAAARGTWEHLRKVVIGLKDHVEANVQQLSEFAVQHDRTMHTDDGERLLMKHQVQHAALLNRLADFVTDIDAKLIVIKGRESRRTCKKTVENMRVFYQAMKFRPGCVTLLSFLLLVITCVIVCVLSYKQNNQSVIFLRLVRSPLFIALYFFMYGANLMAWSRGGINYVSMFDYPAKGIPTPKLAFKIASLLSVCFCSLVAMYFLLDGYYLYIADTIVSSLQWLLLLGLLLSPFKMFIRPGRVAFVLVWFRILVSPFPKVRFGDFWFADQLNSMVALFVDVQYFICHCINTFWFEESDNLNQCTTNYLLIRPIISSLPSLWRFNQCLRCYYDTRQIKHLINAGKYFTTFPVIVFAYIFSSTATPTLSLSNLNWNKTGWIIICWFVSSLIHALYCFIWDITQDWGLFCFHKRTILRPTLLYNSKCLYLAAIVFDFIVRFLCAIKLTLIIVYNFDSDIFYTGLVIAEIARRFVWNFFRVEYEQVMINHKLEVS